MNRHCDDEDGTLSNADDFTAGGHLTPMMRALLQAADCFVSPEPIPHLLLLAPLVPRAQPEGRTAIAALLQHGWLTASSPITVQLTAQSHAFLSTRRSDEPIQIMVVQALCITVSNLVQVRDEAILQLVAPHLCALTDAWQPRNDRYALALNLAMGTYLNAVGSLEQASPYLERANALAAALGTSLAKSTRPWWSLW